MKTIQLTPPFDAAFDQLIPALYSGSALTIKNTQPYAKTQLAAGFLVVSDAGDPLGRIAVYHHPDLKLEGQACLSLGAYECVQDERVAQALFAAVFQFAENHFPGYKLVGPMDGSTWNTYRFVTDGRERAPFLLEPFAMPWYPEQWHAAGFRTLMRYASNLAPLEENFRMDYTKGQQHFESLGLTFRLFDTANAEAELQRLARFNMQAFQEAFLITPTTEAEFVSKNRGVLPFLQPDLVHLALENDEICGLIFGYPNLLDPSGKTVVVKTLARLPGDHLRGLGDLLCARILEAMLNRGYTSMIHALIRDQNASHGNSSRFWGAPYKFYELYIRG